jgi:hypothetical protein
MAGGNVGGRRVIAQKQTRSQGAGGIAYLALHGVESRRKNCIEFLEAQAPKS